MATDALIERCREGYAAAAAQAPVTERTYRIGGRLVAVRAVGAVADRLRRPLGHLETSAAGTPDLTIHAWASDGAAALLDFGEAEPDGVERVRYADLDERRSAMAWPSERLLEAFERGAPHGAAWWWVPDVDSVPLSELAMPFRPIIHWWSESIGLQMVHAAAVGTRDRGAVLLGGPSGSGKSTTALWALRSTRLDILGDDYVLVDPEAADAPEVFSLYTTAKIHEPDRHRVPHIHAEVVGRQEGDKLVAHLLEPYRDRIVERLPLRAILLPRVTPNGPTLTPTTAAAAVRRLAPSTVLQFPGVDHQRVLAAVVRIVGRVPCYDFALGPDPAATTPAIEQLLDAQ